jgi:hypothetical protein
VTITGNSDLSLADAKFVWRRPDYDDAGFSVRMRGNVDATATTTS